MSTVAVVGASTTLGRALLERLDADRAVGRIIGVDLEPPPMPVAKLDFRTGEARDPLLPLALSGAQTVVYLPPRIAGEASDDVHHAVLVRGTERVAAAAEAVGATRFVLLSSGAVYGAHADNPIPLPEDAPLRANPDFPPAHHGRLAEEALEAWGRARPGTDVVVLRPAVVVGAEIDGWVARHLELPRLPMVRGYAPPLQVAHVEDVAAALHLAATVLEPGAYNVACEGWLSAGDVAGLLGRRTVEVPEEVAFGLAARLWRRGLFAGPPGLLHFVMHPWVLASDKLRAAGWAPVHGNREALREFAAAHHEWLALGRLRVRRRELYAGLLAGLGLLAGFAFGGRRPRDHEAEQVHDAA